MQISRVEHRDCRVRLAHEQGDFGTAEDNGLSTRLDQTASVLFMLSD
jgi:hypothetical protein